MRDVNFDDLIRRAQAGDQEALDMLMSWAENQLWRFFVKRFEEHEAADLAQDACIVLLNKLREFEPEHADSFRRYIMKVAGFLAMSRRRERARAWGRRAKLGALVHTPQMSPASRVEAKERKGLLDRCMALLPEIYRRAIEHEFAGGDNESFARREGITLSAARTRRFRAHKLLDTLLENARLTPSSSAPH